MRKNLQLLLALLFFITNILYAQQPPGSCPDDEVELASTCGDACILCEGFDGSTFTNSSPNLGEAPPGFCASQLHNTQWVGFVAGTTEITLDMFVDNCQGTNEGLQTGFYGTPDCSNYNLVSECIDPAGPGTTTFNLTGLVPGQTYFLVVDGFNGDICDFTIDITAGSADAPPILGTAAIVGPTEACAGGMFNYSITGVTGASSWEWTLNGNVIGFEELINVTIPTTGNSFELCVTPASPCSGTLAQTCTMIDILPPTTRTDTLTICDGASYTAENGNTYDTQGDYVYDVTLPSGCSERVTLELTVSPPIMRLEEPVLCFGEVYSEDGQTYTQNGTYTYNNVTPEGCNEIVTVELIILDDIITNINAEICDGDFVEVGGLPFYGAGFYDVVLTAASDCDSTVHLQLTVNQNILTDIPETIYICEGDIYTVFDANDSFDFDETGEYEVNLHTWQGCDSIVTFDLSVDMIPQPVDTFVIICDGDLFQVGNAFYSLPGTYENFLETMGGCDSLITIHLSIYESIDTISAEICAGDVIDFGTGSYDTQGIYPETFTSAIGCDSIVYLDLTVIESIRDTVTAQICTGQSYTQGSSTYTEAGVYEDTFTSAIGCDSIVTLNLEITNLVETFLVIDICEGDDYMVGNSTYDETGVYQDDFITMDGCDSVVYLNLTVNLTLVTNLVESICDGESFTIAASTHTSTGTYQETLTSAVGCDSIINLDLTVLPVPATFLVEAVCDGDSFDVGSSTYNMAGNYIDTLTATNGCDSIISLDLTILPHSTTSLAESICDGESYEVGSSSYTVTGMYQDILMAANGCDSTVSLDLTVIPLPETFLTAQLCQGESYEVGTSVYTSTGLYQDNLTAASGCDSIVYLNLTIDPVYDIDIMASICDGAVFNVGTSSYSVTGIYQDILTSVDGCDSIVNLNLTITDFYETFLNEDICDGEFYTIGAEVFDATGDYQAVFIAQDGCDSFVNLALTVLPILETAFEITICDGESYTFGANDFDMAGVYEDTFTADETGCDSIVTLTLIVNDLFETILTEFICDGENFEVGTSVYTETGLYTDVLTAENGCDSTILLNLTVHDLPETTLTEEICDGESFNVAASTYTETGTYTDVIPSLVTGCDSTITLNLTVHELPETFLTEEICAGENFIVGTSTYTEMGDYTDILTSVITGCDSMVHLALTVNPLYDVVLDEVICNDENFEVGNLSFSSTGTFVVDLQSVDGCDSIVTLNLITHPCVLALSMDEENPTCNGMSDGNINFAMTVGVPPYNYTWESLTGPSNGNGIIDNNNETTMLDGLPAGNYSITITDFYDIAYNVTVTINQPDALALSATPSQFGVFNVSCPGEEDGEIQSLVAGGTAPYTYEWSNGESTASISQLSIGDYELTITDLMGCDENIALSLIAPDPILAEVAIENPLCFGDNKGGLKLSSVEGGTSPYLYAINQQSYSSSPIFNNLPTGEYQLSVEDVNGCTWEEMFEVAAAEELVVDLGDDHYIELGESVNLEAITTYPVDSFSWDSNLYFFDCLNALCDTREVSPLITTMYHVDVVDENGCTSKDEITVFVDKPRNVFIPNAFSPNNDGQNDLLTIYTGSDVVAIHSFQIFNRWGETMFEQFNREPGSLLLGWDGKHREKVMNTGIYVYFAEIEFLDGEVIIYKGDVVLMR